MIGCVELALDRRIATAIGKLGDKVDPDIRAAPTLLGGPLRVAQDPGIELTLCVVVLEEDPDQPFEVVSFLSSVP